MKTKKINKKLALVKETISNLGRKELKTVIGGHLYSHSPIEGSCLCPEN